MNTKDFINKHREKKNFSSNNYKKVIKTYNVAGEPLIKCKDAIMTTGKYTGIRVSDIFIFDSSFLKDYLLKNKYVDDDLKEIIREVIRNQSKGLEEVFCDSVLGN